jgi:ribosome-binding protein aMBF1 (putative translation factor)
MAKIVWDREEYNKRKASRAQGVAAKLGVNRDDFPQQEQELPQEIAGQSWREIIKTRIESKDYSFNELGNAIKVSPSVVTRFVKGQRDVRLDTAEKMCEELDLVLVPREWLEKADQ